MRKDDKKEYHKKYTKYYSRKGYKTVAKSPENGQTLDVVDMIQRNEERYQYELDLNV
jgi:hypothetical protein